MLAVWNPDLEESLCFISTRRDGLTHKIENARQSPNRGGRTGLFTAYLGNTTVEIEPTLLATVGQLALSKVLSVSAAARSHAGIDAA